MEYNNLQRPVGFIATLLALTTLVLMPLYAAAEASSSRVELFGVELQGATRDTLRETFDDNDLKVEREDDNYWVDVYDASGVLKEASELQVGYVSADNTFAYAQYTFPSSMDTEQVQRIIDLVATKYGSPASINGRTRLGSVNAQWKLGDGMRIKVSRGWPDTTTYLQYIDRDAKRRMDEEIEEVRRARERQEAESQDRAF